MASSHSPQAAAPTEKPAPATPRERTRKRQTAAAAALDATAAARAKAARATQARAQYASERSERSDPLKETLRQCRAAGYHAAKCVQLGCTATQYGLACKGAASAQR